MSPVILEEERPAKEIETVEDEGYVKEIEKAGLDYEARSELAARYVAFEKGLTFFQTVKIYWKSTFWILYGLLVVFGYDYGEKFATNGTVSYIITAVWISLFNGISQVAAVLGAYIAGYLAGKIGRKYTNLLACIISMGGVGAQYASNGSLPIMIVGKTISGFPIGMWLVLGPLYASEVAALKLRGWLVAMTNIVQLSGVFVFTGVIYQVGSLECPASYKIPIACQWIIPALVVPTIFFWPESPVWLARVGRREDAIRSIGRLYGESDKIDCDGEQQMSGRSKTPYLECFTKLHRRRTLICMFVYVCQYLSGLVFVLGYQSYYYQLIGFTAQKSFLLGMINNGLMIIATVCSWFLITTVGRRPLVVWGQFLGAIFLFIVAGCSLAGTRPGYVATVSFMFIWAFSYQLTLGTTAWTVVGEIPALKLRAATQGLANISLCVTQWAVGFVFPYLFNPESANLQGRVRFIFGATTFVGFLGVYFYLPETRNKTADELDAIFEECIKGKMEPEDRVQPSP